MWVITANSNQNFQGSLEASGRTKSVCGGCKQFLVLMLLGGNMRNKHERLIKFSFFNNIFLQYNLALIITEN